jgi:hypothetical protein
MDTRAVVAMVAILGGSLVACDTAADSADTDRADDTDARFARPWDFVHVFPDPETAAARDAMLGLDDLGIDDALFAAMLGHATQAHRLPGTAAEDSVLRSGQLAPRIFHETCVRDPRTWRVSQVRFAPYETLVPGTVSAYRAWASARGGAIDLGIHLRVSLHSYCDRDSFVLREDQAFHLIYAVVPDDDGLAGRLLGSAEQFAAAALGPDADPDQALRALESHLEVLGSPAYAAFRRDVLREWASLAALDDSPAAAYAQLDADADSFRRAGVARVDDLFGQDVASIPFGTGAHPALGADTPLRRRLRELVIARAGSGALVRVAAMFTEGSQDGRDSRWFFSAMAPGRYARVGEMAPAAQAVYGRVVPLELDTFIARVVGGGVEVVRATEAGFYSEARGIITGPVAVHPASLQSEVRRVDYDTPPVRAKPEEGGDDGMAQLPTGSTLRTAMDRFADPGVTNATTTPCDRCHNMQNIERHESATGYRQSAQTRDAYFFHLATASGLSLRTVREVDLELPRAARELEQGPP